VKQVAFIMKALEEENFVLLQFQGKLTVSELVKTRKAIKLFLKETPRRKVLVDLQNISNALSITDIHGFVSSHTKEHAVSMRIALIVDSRDLNDAIFAENVAYNHGIGMRAFNSSALAKEWLAMG
jgi:hypothetical protein